MPSVGQLPPRGARTCLTPDHGKRSDTMSIRDDDSCGYSTLGDDR